MDYPQAYEPTSGIGRWYYSLSPKGRTFVSVVGVALGAAAVYLSYKGIKNAYGRIGENKAVNETNKEYQKLKDSGQTLSHVPSVYQSAANAIAKWLDGCETFETEMQVVQKIMLIVKKQIDWTYLQKVFGVKSIDDCGPGGSTQYDLSTLLNDQLDSSGAYKINVPGYSAQGYTSNSIDVLRNYFKTKGITI